MILDVSASAHLAVVCLVATQVPRVSWSSTSSSSCSRSPSCSCCATKLRSCASICSQLSQLSSCVSLIDIICTRCRMVFSRSLPGKYFLNASTIFEGLSLIYFYRLSLIYFYRQSVACDPGPGAWRAPWARTWRGWAAPGSPRGTARPGRGTPV